jgi:hypothetical protein
MLEKVRRKDQKSYCNTIVRDNVCNTVLEIKIK